MMLKYTGKLAFFNFMTQIIILAAGKGTRMGSELPKVLVPLNGRSMISYLMDSVKKSEVDPEPIIVVSPDNIDVIKKALSSYSAQYVIQDKQLGTGHAVSCARSSIEKEADNVLVLYGDHPFLTSDSIIQLASLKPKAVAIAPTRLPDFSDWRHNFYGWGRIVRSNNGGVTGIVEYKDADEEQRQITEVNPGFMCFNKDWLFTNIDKLQDNNKAHELYLTDMVSIAFKEGHSIETTSIEPKEAMGVNSPEELSVAQNLSS